MSYCVFSDPRDGGDQPDPVITVQSSFALAV